MPAHAASPSTIPASTTLPRANWASPMAVMASGSRSQLISPEASTMGEAATVSASHDARPSRRPSLAVARISSRKQTKSTTVVMPKNATLASICPCVGVPGPMGATSPAARTDSRMATPTSGENVRPAPLKGVAPTAKPCPRNVPWMSE